MYNKGGIIMLSVRLPSELEEKLVKVAKMKKVTKTDIVSEALNKYLDEFEKQLSPYELGKDLFGNAGTKEKNSSQNYKEKVREKINKKYSKHNS